MRVLTLGNLYRPQHLGGYELVWQATVRAQRGHGHVARVMCTDTMLAPGAREHTAEQFHARVEEALTGVVGAP